MALAKKQSKSNTVILFSVIGLIVIVVGYFVYTKVIMKNGLANNSNGGPSGTTDLLNFDASIIQDPRLSNLQDFSQTVNKPDAVGQPYPFR